MAAEITMNPIGIIHTSDKTIEGVPIQGIFEENIIGKIEVFQEY